MKATELISQRKRESLNWAIRRQSLNQLVTMHAPQHEVPVGFWVCCTVILYLVLITAKGFSGDLEFWLDWSRHLQQHGLAGLNANYPPVYIYWLWGVAKFHALVGIEIAPTYWFELMVTLPVLLCHVGLLLFVNHLSTNAGRITASRHQFLLLGGVALNIALLVDGPLWGQVDLLYCFPLVCALYFLIHGRNLVWALPLLTISVLTKFQTICVALLVLPLLWHRRSRSLWSGALVALGLLVALLLPYQFAGNLEQMVRETYLKAADMYPYATMNAHNLWFFLDLNHLSQHLSVWPQFPISLYVSLTPNYLGKGLFLLLGLWVMVRAFRSDEPCQYWRYALLLAMGFFLLLPAMHERYLMSAVVVAGTAASVYPMYLSAFFVLSGIAAANMWFVLHPVGGDVPWLLSLVTLIFFVSGLFPKTVKKLWNWCCTLPKTAWSLTALILWFVVALKYFLPLLPLSSGWLDATTVTDRQVVQGWGTLGINKSVEGNPLSVKGRMYGHGFGTHAASQITLKVPAGVDEFTTACGVDDEVSAGELECSVHLDGLVVSKTGILKSKDAPVDMSMPVRQGQQLVLTVDEVGKIDGDHADWLSPRFRLKSAQ